MNTHCNNNRTVNSILQQKLHTSSLKPQPKPTVNKQYYNSLNSIPSLPSEENRPGGHHDFPSLNGSNNNSQQEHISNDVPNNDVIESLSNQTHLISPGKNESYPEYNYENRNNDDLDNEGSRLLHKLRDEMQITANGQLVLNSNSSSNYCNGNNINNNINNNIPDNYIPTNKSNNKNNNVKDLIITTHNDTPATWRKHTKNNSNTNYNSTKQFNTFHNHKSSSRMSVRTNNKTTSQPKSKYEQYNIQNWTYEAYHNYCKCHPKAGSFFARMKFYAIKQQTKMEILDKLIDNIKPKILESEKVFVFNRWIEDSNRRVEANNRVELLNSNKGIANNIYQSETNILKEPKILFDRIEWEKKYQTTVTEHWKERNQNLELLRRVKWKEKEEEENKIVSQIKSLNRKASRSEIQKISERMYNEAKRRRLKSEINQVNTEDIRGLNRNNAGSYSMKSYSYHTLTRANKSYNKFKPSGVNRYKNNINSWQSYDSISNKNEHVRTININPNNKTTLGAPKYRRTRGRIVKNNSLSNWRSLFNDNKNQTNSNISPTNANREESKLWLEYMNKYTDNKIILNEERIKNWGWDCDEGKWYKNSINFPNNSKKNTWSNNHNRDRNYGKGGNKCERKDNAKFMSYHTAEKMINSFFIKKKH